MSECVIAAIICGVVVLVFIVGPVVTELFFGDDDDPQSWTIHG